jgi:hypothetical protein
MVAAATPRQQAALSDGLGALPGPSYALPAGPTTGRPAAPVPAQRSGPYALPAGSPAAHAAGEHLREPAHASANGVLPRHSELGPALALPAGSSRPAGGGLSTMNAPAAGDGDEPVIFREMQARWFGGPTPARPDAATDGSRGTAAPATGSAQHTPAGAGGSAQGSNGNSAGQESSEFMDDEYGWRSAGDEGWLAASAAAQPRVAATTDAGLPRRTPSAQLVPGAVPQFSNEAAGGRRDPDDVRGVLAAYHRGVQRGRGGGEAQSAGHPRSADEEMH